jgi:hypothetical protein
MREVDFWIRFAMRSEWYCHDRDDPRRIAGIRVLAR